MKRFLDMNWIEDKSFCCIRTVFEEYQIDVLNDAKVMCDVTPSTWITTEMSVPHWNSQMTKFDMVCDVPPE